MYYYYSYFYLLIYNKTNDSDLFERRWLLSGIFCLLMLLTWTVFLVGEKTFLYRPIRAWPTIIFFKFYGRFFRPMLAALSRHQTMRMSRFVHVSIHSPLTIANSLLFTWKKLFFYFLLLQLKFNSLILKASGIGQMSIIKNIHNNIKKKKKELKRLGRRRATCRTR